MKKILLAVIVLISYGGLAKAQDPQVTSAVSTTITGVTELVVGGGGIVAPATSFNFNSVELLNTGITKAAEFSIVAKSNTKYYISVSAPASWTPDEAVQVPLPIGALAVAAREDNTEPSISEWVQLSAGSNSLIGTASPTGKKAAGEKTYYISYKMNPGFTVSPATYSGTLTFTLTAE